MKAGRYDIVISSSMGDLIIQTNRLVKDGYIPLDGCKSTNDGKMYYQTMWKPDYDVAIVPTNQVGEMEDYLDVTEGES